MRGDTAFRVEGRVMVSRPDGTFQVELPNGHQLLAFCSRRDRMEFAGMQPGMLVKVQLTPFDLSTGRLLAETKNDLT